MPRNALGRGLGALIRESEQKPEPQPAPVQSQPSTASGAAAAAVRQLTGPQEVDIDLIEPSPYQPRTRFREEALEELARSIKTSGIIQPLVVRPTGSRFQLIAGERRWRAAQRAGLGKVSVIVKQVPWCAPGNGGIAADAECVAIDAGDVDALIAFAEKIGRLLRMLSGS